MRGVAGDDEEVRALLLQSARHRDQDGCGILAAAFEQGGDARGNFRIVVDQNMDVIGIVARRDSGDQAALEFDRRFRSHAADHTGGLFARRAQE